MITKTHTYATLELSTDAYGEIRDKLVAAGYQDTFIQNGDGTPDLIPMNGIAVRDMPSAPPTGDVIEKTLNLLPEVTWDRFSQFAHCGISVFGWIPREDGRSDFILLNIHLVYGACFISTSSAKHSEEFANRLGFTAPHNPCLRVEDVYKKVKAVKLSDEVPRRKTGVELIAEERATHEGKGWTAAHDDKHVGGELAIVAARLCLCDPAPGDDWDLVYKTRSEGGRRRQLIVAGALIAAELDREERRGWPVMAKKDMRFAGVPEVSKGEVVYTIATGYPDFLYKYEGRCGFIFKKAIGQWQPMNNAVILPFETRISEAEARELFKDAFEPV